MPLRCTACRTPSCGAGAGWWWDGARVAETFRREDTEEDTATELSIAVILTAEQAVSVQNYDSTSVHGINEGTGLMYSWFSGYLVKAY